MKVMVNKAELLTVLEKNRAAHHGIFLEALDGYKKKAIELFEKELERIRKQKGKRNFRVYVTLTQPVDHTDDYDTVIGLIKLADGDFVPLDDDEYRKYFQDTWDWSRQFVSSNSYYSVTAAQMEKKLGEDD